MNIGLTGPISVELLGDLVDRGGQMPKCHSFPMIAVLAREYVRMGHCVAVFALSYDVLEPQVFRGNSVTIHILPCRRKRYAYDFFRKERDFLRTAILSERCDVVHANWTYEFAAGVIDSGRPHVVSAHDALWKVLPYMPLRSLGFWACRGLLCNYVLRHTMRLTVLTEYLRNYYRRQGYRGEIAVVPEGLSDEAIDGTVPRQHFGEEPVFACILNGWGRRKNGMAAINGFSEYRKRHPCSRLIMFGCDHGKGEACENWAKERGVADGVEFAGDTAYIRLMRRLQEDVDVLIHPAREESFCIAAIEAMNAGLPVIAGRDSGAVGSVVGDGGILLSDVDCAEELVAAMETLRDSSVRSRLGKTGREHVRRDYRMSNIALLYSNILTQELAKRKKS